MPRSERRRWWLERRRPGVIQSYIFEASEDEDRHGWSPADQRHTALWRLVQWQRIRIAYLAGCLSRALPQAVQGAIVAEALRGIQSHAGSLLLDADAAVMEARVNEERMRVELEQARDEIKRHNCVWPLCDSCADRCSESNDPDCDYPNCSTCCERDTCADRYEPPTDGMPF